MPFRGQAIIWTNDGLVYWHIWVAQPQWVNHLMAISQEILKKINPWDLFENHTDMIITTSPRGHRVKPRLAGDTRFFPFILLHVSEWNVACYQIDLLVTCGSAWFISIYWKMERLPNVIAISLGYLDICEMVRISCKINWQQMYVIWWNVISIRSFSS